MSAWKERVHHGGFCFGMKVCLWCCREESYNGLNILKVYYNKEKIKILVGCECIP